MKHIPALQFRRHFGKVLDDIVRAGTPVTITRANKPLVVMVPADAYAETLQPAAVRETRLRLAVERVAEWKARHARALKGLDPVALIRKDRDSR